MKQDIYPNIKLVNCVSEVEFAELVCLNLFNKYVQTINRSRNFNLVLSGGRTPILIYEYLRINYLNKFDWEKVFFYFVDERCVKPSSPISNYFNAKKHLFDYIDLPNVIRLKGEIDPLKAANEYDGLLKGVILHCAILGMGEDGHVGSIFPDSPELLELANVISTKQKHFNYRRLSLGLNAINKIECKILIINKSKAKLNILKSGDLSYPINRLSKLIVLANDSV